LKSALKLPLVAVFLWFDYVDNVTLQDGALKPYNSAICWTGFPYSAKITMSEKMLVDQGDMPVATH